MPGPYDAKAVANAILEKSFQEKKPVSPLKLQKLLYYAHGYYSAAAGVPLIDQPFEAWEYGPVVPSLYREFRHCGNSPINSLASDYSWELEDFCPVPPVSDDRKMRRVIDFVWEAYGDYSPIELSEMTHQPDSPWDRTRKKNKGIKNADISQEMIEAYFSPLVNKKSA
ncbi:Panacea domain-containing protein [Terrihabitans rhizophilus]|uniref:DUF4065 domain-containing protein n=1 Tax=Terrihabitans rhizophilus TaxID=3092662 RepID=A0ABU4RPA6_9HYPH|nr:type II toxin-antitoxin system antitoxin SocA domain-containing protein [Terrihabitans sp. PJ23]MDX6806441.1 DUF4065 domain-containing protein [Terrihabitans sp. PJ23]